MKGLIFTMLVLGSFSVFAASTGQSVVNAAGADCGERSVSEIMDNGSANGAAADTTGTVEQ
jgi:hypothetical protein